MKTKLNKIAKTIAVGIFFMALFFNVKVTLEDPFFELDNKVIAQTSSGNTGNTTCWDTITYMEANQVLYCSTCNYVSNSKPSFWASKSTC